MKLLELRKQIKKKKPEFVRQDFRKSRLQRKWRKPRGIDSKQRLHIKGNPIKVTKGFGSPKAVKGLHKSGMAAVLVASLNELESIDKAKQGIVIRGSVGARKKVELVKKAKELGIKILNLKDADKFLKGVEEKLKAKKEAKKKVVEKKEKKAKELKEKKAEKKEAELADKVKTDEEKKEEEKKEKDMVLTKRS